MTTLLFGWISDRTGRRKAIVWVSALLSASGLVIAALAPDLGTFLVAMMLVGGAQGAFVSVDIAMMTEVLPDFEEAGKDLGIVSLSYQLPQVLGRLSIAEMSAKPTEASMKGRTAIDPSHRPLPIGAPCVTRTIEWNGLDRCWPFDGPRC